MYGATLRRLASKMGVSGGMITYHFRNKREIVIAAVESAMDQVRAARTAAEEDPTQTRPLGADLRYMLDRHATDDPNYPAISFWLEIAAEASRDPELRELYMQVFREQRDQLTRRLATEQTLGKFRHDFAPDLLADLVTCLHTGVDLAIGLKNPDIPLDRALAIFHLMSELCSEPGEDGSAGKA